MKKIEGNDYLGAMASNIKCTLLLVLSILAFDFGLMAQQAPSVITESSHPIVQKTFIYPPGYSKEDLKKPVNFGPSLSETYIDASDVKTLGDLQKAFDLSKMYLPKGWPEKYDVKKGQIVILKYANGVELPVIQTPDGTYFSIFTEEGYFTCDIKTWEENDDGTKRAIFMTAELFRDE